MTRAKIDNTLYTHLESEVTQALPLEYAIRAARQAFPSEWAKLVDMDRRIRQHWRDLGASEKAIDGEQLMEFAWDTMQKGFPMSRRHNRIYSDQSTLKLINQGLSDIPKKFGEAVNELQLPATTYFRICDLLNGNDILAMMKVVSKCLVDAKDVEKCRDLSLQERYFSKQQFEEQGNGTAQVEPKPTQRKRSRVELDQVGLEKFILGIRVPIHLHPGMHYVARDRSGGEAPAESFGILLDTDATFEMPDLYRQIREFLYQFAVRRQALLPSIKNDATSRALIQDFLRDELLGKVGRRRPTRLDGLVGPLAGLHCWDLARLHEQKGRRAPIECAIDDAFQNYPKDVRAIGRDAMRKNYYQARDEILRMPFMPDVPRRVLKEHKPQKTLTQEEIREFLDPEWKAPANWISQLLANPEDKTHN